MQNKKRHISLSVKINILIVIILLLVSGGLVWNSYYVYSQKVDEVYYAQAQQAVIITRDAIIPEFVEHFRNHIDTDEFREVRQKALTANDEDIIRQWMNTKSSAIDLYYDYIDPDDWDELAFQMDIDLQGHPDDLTLYLDYTYLTEMLSSSLDIFDVTDVYLQYIENDVTYNLVDPVENLFYIGSAEKSMKAYPIHTGNSEVYSARYHTDSGWILTVDLPVFTRSAENIDQVVGHVCVDIDMSLVMESRLHYLVRSAFFVLGLTASAIFIGMLMMHRIAVDPLRQLASATTGFARDDREVTKNDVIELPINSDDEIEDLYHEIQSMQSRIVDYTDHVKRITVERERVSAELNMARTIQASMLPSVFPAFPDRTDFDLYASMTPAKEVAGDFYDFFLIDEDHLCVLIADVSDKGVPAALFMMSSKGLINYRAQAGGTPGEILTDINQQICRNNKSIMFVTVWLAILDLKTGDMVCSNAGHEFPAIRVKDGKFRIFRDKHGLVIGAFETTKYQDYKLKLAPGDAVFVYTDGITDAKNTAGEFYGMERMMQALDRLADKKPQEILDGVKTDIDGFMAGARQFDDLTMLCLEYRGGQTSIS